MEAEWEDFTVSKLDGAQRQIETAIELWFAHGEPVSIHMLAAGGHQVCHAIAKKRGIKSPVFFNDSFLPPKEFDDFKKFLLKIEGFFKHADRDPDPFATLTFKPYVSAFYILDAIELFHAIGGVLSALMLAFRARMAHEFPGLIQTTKSFQDPLFIEAGKMPRAEFLKHFLEVAAHLRPQL